VAQSGKPGNQENASPDEICFRTPRLPLSILHVPHPPPKKENLLVNLICNIALPTLILTKLSGDRWLGPVVGLVLALAFPLGYGIYDYLQRRRANFISIAGFASVMLTGGLGLMKVGGIWFAVKDAAVPLVLGAGVMFSLRSKTPIVREIFFNDQLMDVPRVEAALVERGNEEGFRRLLTTASFWLGGAFVISAGLNFCLARYLLKSPPGTPEFNAELGRMHLLSWPVIVLPSMVVMMLAFWRMMTGLKQLTGLTLDEIFKVQEPKA
jgi:hypothetical protein